MSIEFEEADNTNSSDPLDVMSWQIELIDKCLQWHEQYATTYDALQEDCIKTITTAFDQIARAQRLIKKQMNNA